MSAALARLRTRSAIGAVLVVGFFTALVVWGALTDQGRLSESQLSGMTLAAYRSVEVGESEGAVRKRVGEGQDALEFREEGVATEPPNARCVYYRWRSFELGSFQLCFRNHVLVSKARY